MTGEEAAELLRCETIWARWRLIRWDRAEGPRKEQLRERLLIHAAALRRLCDDIEAMVW